METFPEYPNFGNYYFRKIGEPCFSQQTPQLWTIFIYYGFQMEAFSSVFEDDKHDNLRQSAFWPCFGLQEKSKYGIFS